MKLSELQELVNVRRPAPPYGVRRLARVHSVEDLRRLAKRRIPAAAFNYIEGGGEDEVTMRRNRAAFDELELVPRVLRDVSKIELTTTVLGEPFALPMVIAPIGSPRLFHHEGELASARAAAHCGIPFTLSSAGTQSIERLAAEAGGTLWYQLYVWSDRPLVEELLSRAKASGYRAVVITVDTAVHSKRERELRSGIMLPNPALRPRTVLEGSLHPDWWWHFLTSEAIRFANLTPKDAPPSASFDKMKRSFDGSFNWADLEWIRAIWDGTLVLKGVQSVEDARRAADAGVDGIVVSNHGGRQLDHVPAAIDSLAPIAQAVGDRLDVLMDGGIRRGTDILTALSLGAKACLLGRAHVYGLAAAGEPGVRTAIDVLTHELRLAMALAGVTRIEDIDGSYVRRRRAGGM